METPFLPELLPALKMEKLQKLIVYRKVLDLVPLNFMFLERKKIYQTLILFIIFLVHQLFVSQPSKV